jgi:hypothetical protein
MTRDRDASPSLATLQVGRAARAIPLGDLLRRWHANCTVVLLRERV